MKPTSDILPTRPSNIPIRRPNTTDPSRMTILYKCINNQLRLILSQIKSSSGTPDTVH